MPKIYFDNTDIARKLAQKFAREVRSRGDEISLHDAQTIVARAFGYQHYTEPVHADRVAGSGKPNWRPRKVRFSGFVDFASAASDRAANV